MLRRDETPGSLNIWASPTLLVTIIAIVLGLLFGLSVKSFSPLYLIVGLVGVIVSIITIFNPELGLLALVVITYIRLSDVAVHYYNAPSIAKPFVAFLIVVIFLQWLFYAKPARNWEKAAFLVFGYGLVIFLSLFYASNFDLASQAINDFWKDGLIAVIIVILLRNASSMRHVVWALIGVCIFLGSISVFQFLTHSFSNAYWGFGVAGLQNISGTSSGYRIAGPIGDPNFYAQIMVVLVPISYIRFLDEKRLILKALALYSTAVAVLSVVFTFSRGGFLALLVVIAVLFWFNAPKPTQLIFMVLLGFAMFRFVPTSYFDRLLTLPGLFTGSQQSVLGEVSFRGRASELTAAWMMFADHPILGVGAQNYPVYYQQYSRRIGLDPRTEARQAHSLYLEVAAEMGLAGLAIFVTILWNIFSSLTVSWRRLIQAGDKEHANYVLSIAIGILGYFTASLFIHGAYPRYMWILVGIALALPQVVDSILASGVKERDE
jgi:O-antigen ligase